MASINKSRTIVSVMVVAAVLLGGIFWANSNGQSAADSKENAAKTEKKEASPAQKPADNKAAKEDSKKDTTKPAAAIPVGQAVATTTFDVKDGYGFSAGEGESYTNLARTAISKVDSKLSAAERVAAETKLAQDASAQYLEVGQKVELKRSNIRAAIDWAKKLPAEQKAGWQYYADQVIW